MMRSGPHGALFEYICEFLIKSKLISEGIASNLLVSESLRWGRERQNYRSGKILTSILVAKEVKWKELECGLGMNLSAGNHQEHDIGYPTPPTRHLIHRSSGAGKRDSPAARTLQHLSHQQDLLRTHWIITEQRLIRSVELPKRDVGHRWLTWKTSAHANEYPTRFSNWLHYFRWNVMFFTFNELSMTDSNRTLSTISSSQMAMTPKPIFKWWTEIACRSQIV